MFPKSAYSIPLSEEQELGNHRDRESSGVRRIGWRNWNIVEGVAWEETWILVNYL